MRTHERNSISLAGQSMSVPPCITDASDHAYVDARICISQPRVRYMNCIDSQMDGLAVPSHQANPDTKLWRKVNLACVRLRKLFSSEQKPTTQLDKWNQVSVMSEAITKKQWRYRHPVIIYRFSWDVKVYKWIFLLYGYCLRRKSSEPE